MKNSPSTTPMVTNSTIVLRTPRSVEADESNVPDDSGDTGPDAASSMSHKVHTHIDASIGLRGKLPRTLAFGRP